MTDCDRCDGKNVNVKTFYVETGRDFDPAGGASSPAGDRFDLCDKCMAFIINSVIKKLQSYDEAEIWIKSLNLKHKDRF